MLQRVLCAIMVVVVLLAHSNTYAADEANKLELPPKIEVEKGTAQLQLPISLTNVVAITGFQCDLYLPDGFTILTDKYDDYLIELARTTTKRHSLATREMPDGALRIVLSSMTNATFSGNSGSVLNITVAVGEGVAAGSYDVNLKNVVLTDPSAARYPSADVSGSIVVKESEIVISEDVKLELSPEIKTEKGVSEFLMPILLTNKVDVTGFQCDLYLPDGFSVARDEYDDYLIDVARTTTKRHSLATREMPDGALRIVLSSMTNATFSGDSGAVLNITIVVSSNAGVGSYVVGLRNIVLTNPNATRYTSADVTELFVIEEQPVSITAQNLTMQYGEKVPTLTYTSEGAELKGVPLLSCDVTPSSPVGIYPIIVSKGTVENKEVTYINGILTITKAPLNISVGNCTKKQGEALPEFIITYSGFKNNETKDVLTKQPSVSCEATSATVPGKYDIIVSGAAADNYEITYTNGTLTINEADPVKVTAKSYTISYGDAIPEFEYTSEGKALEGTPAISCEATSTSPVGTYPIVISKGSVTNYNDSYVNGVLTITKAPLKISVGNYEKKQYDAMPEFVLSYEGFKNNETKEVLTKQPTVSCEANEDSAPGEYAITVSGAEATNYQIQYVAGTLTVTEPDSYTLTYMVDGEVYQSFSIKYRDVITPLAVPTKEGYTFSGWSEIPETMPAKDVTVTGSFAVNSYSLTYMVDGEVYKTSPIPYGTTLTPESDPTKEGYTFSGWSEIPETMPAKDVTVTGSFSINSYTLTYMVDGEVYKTSSIPYGTTLTSEPTPTKEGYTFSGWSEIPSTMPAKDVTVTGTFSINKYKLIYKVDGTDYKTVEVEYGAKIIPEADPTKEGYTFSGWNEIPKTMPAKDVTVTGTFTINSYTLTYMVDGEVYQSFIVKYKEAIKPLEAPTKEGYTFSGWDGLPRSMPANDVIVKGYFTINSYTITYVLDGEVYTTETLEYGAKIVPPVIPGLEDYTIWEDVPATMPASDITVNGKAKDIIDSLTSVFSRGEGDVYDSNGRKLPSLQKGLNIIRMKDGTVKKIIIK